MPSDRVAPGPDAVLLDMDGTLVDTEGLWWQAAEAVAESLGRRLSPADVPHVHGRTVEDVAAYLVQDEPAGHPVPDDVTERAIPDDTAGRAFSAVADRLTDAFAARVAADVTVVPGARELLDGLAAAAIPTALVSASPRRVVDLVLPRLDHPFDLVIANEDTARGKPYPDPYLEAARRLGTTPARCVAIEDSPAGVAAARKAGCHVLVVEPQHGLPSLDRVQGVCAEPGPVGKLARRER
ncbi:HAD superfamily hydrolase (TIGR01509 family)/HAD superfamily hydrolase (TIGR01549 family) [Nonomuraea polychroma]|uniref:HAD superfamily hydrolase (TIGR01509 family)/HAD superfamily hydrolase (TIGR01549 family) n=1 Tax=Nonomuraea polychroma TaxID=46176 RepID=A0A438MDH8_9ACTN|nr:HAD superfamily hydrolase (TIGR01509 family)/HAD superfamily hydrolase (TIGR01549 family) [Nonomuraea polychroma]